MKTIVFCFPNCAFLSETSRMVEIYRNLQKLGVPAKIVTHGGTYEFVFKNENIQYEKIEPILTHKDCIDYLNAVAKPWTNLYKKSVLFKTVTSEIEFFKTNRAGAVVTGFQLTTVLSARSLKIPLVVTHLGSLVPPVIENDMHDCSECFDNPFFNLIPKKIMNRLVLKFFLSLPLQKRLFNKVAKGLNIESVHSLFDMLMGDLTLVTDVPEILGIPEEEMDAWTPKVKYFRNSARLKYAGPIFAQLFGNIPENVHSFLQTTKPKIFVAMASGERKNLQMVYDTLLSMEVCTVFCSLVHNQIFKSAENILVVDYLPSHLVMPLCDLAIIHGGQGSVQTAISAGIPLIGFPIQPEQNFNLKQVEKLGAGICLSIRSLKKGVLVETINKILKNDSYKKSMKQLQSWQSRRDGALEAARIVSHLID